MSQAETSFQYFGLDDLHKELIAKAGAHAPWVELAPLDKGLSGSLALMARWSVSGASSKFHVFKIGNPRKLKREHDAINDVAAPLVRNFRHAALYLSNDGTRALLSQEFVGESDGSTRNLRQYIQKADDVSTVVDVLRRLYEERLIDWKPKSETRRITTVGEELRAWTDKGDLAVAFANIGAVGLNKSLKTRYDLEYDGLAALVKKILRNSIEIIKGPVHGDLHSQNVLVGKDLNISLIDFGWTAIRWRAIDYLWLECSLKFVVASPYTDIEDVLMVEEIVDDTWLSGTSIDTSLLEDRLLSGDLKKIAAGVGLIREKVCSELSDLTLTDYRKGLIAMSYALTTFPTLNLVYLTHSLARNAKLVEPELDDEGPYHALYRSRDILWRGRAGRMVIKANEFATAPGKALDIGCGDGKDILYLEEAG
jgi:hypothetical protein